MQSEHKCNTCFYKNFDKDNDFPCKACEGYNAYINYMAYQPVDFKTISTWDNEDVFDGYYGGSEDYVERKDSASDSINSPKHYTAGKYEVIDVIEDWDLNFRLANTIKYIARHKHKGKPLEDLKKALWYLQREIDLYELRDHS